MKKSKILSVILSIMMLASFIPSAFAADGKYTLDFETDGILATLKANGSDFESAETQYEIVAEAGRGKVFHGKEGGSNVTVKDPGLANVDVSDKVRIAFDFKQKNNGSISQFRLNGVTLKQMHWENGYSAGQWNHAEFILDIATGEVTRTITNASGVVKEDGATETFAGLKNIKSISSFGLMSWSNAANGETYWDNVEIEKYVEQASVKVESYAQDFEADGIIATLTAAGSTFTDNQFEIITDGDRGKVLHAKEGTANAVVKEDNLKNVKIYDETHISFDFKKKNNGSQSKFIIATDKGEAQIGYMMWECFYKGSIISGISFSNGSWHHVDMVINTATGKVSYTVKKDGGTATTAEATFDELKGMTKINSISLQSFDGAGHKGETWWDNIEVKKYVAPVKVTKYTQDFETDGILATLKANGSDFESADTQYEIVEEEGYGKVFHGKEGGSNVTVKDPGLANVDVSDKVRIAFDFKQKNNGSISQFRLNGVTLKQMHWENGYSAGQWNHAEFILDTATGEVTRTITNASGVVKEDGATETFTGLKNIKSISSFGLMSWSNAANGETYWDNVEIERYYVQPKVKSVDFYVGDKKQSSNTNVVAAANKIVIDFGVEMDEDTLADEITINDCTFKGAVDGEKYVMTLDNALTANKAYTLTVSKDAKSVNDKTLGSAYTLEFTANKGEFNVSFNGVKQGGAGVENVSGLVKGQEATVEFEYTNTTAKPQTAKLIYAYYNGTKLEKCKIVNITIDATDYSGTKVEKFTADSDLTFDELDIMLWSDMETIVPLTSNIEL